MFLFALMIVFCSCIFEVSSLSMWKWNEFLLVAFSILISQLCLLFVKCVCPLTRDQVMQGCGSGFSCFERIRIRILKWSESDYQSEYQDYSLNPAKSKYFYKKKNHLNFHYRFLCKIRVNFIRSYQDQNPVYFTGGRIRNAAFHYSWTRVFFSGLGFGEAFIL